MKHAGEEALDALEQLLEQVRKHTMLRERKRGTFYNGSKAFLHFHEDPAGLFADLWVGTEWARFPVTSRKQQKAFLVQLEYSAVRGQCSGQELSDPQAKCQGSETKRSA